MSAVELRAVAAEEAELRLDRWFRRHFPGLSHGRLQKLLRTGQVRIDGRRADAAARLRAGQRIRIPPLAEVAEGAAPRRAPAVIEQGDAEWLRSRILHEDDALLVLDKPAGLAVQGGTGTRRHLDGMLEALAGERRATAPRAPSRPRHQRAPGGRQDGARRGEPDRSVPPASGAASSTGLWWSADRRRWTA